MYLDLLLIVTILLLSVTSGAFFFYYRRIRRVKEEYEKARNVVEDVVTSFNSQLERQQGRLAGVAQRTEMLTSEAAKVAARSEEYHRRSQELENGLESVSSTVSNTEKNLVVQIQKLTKRVDEFGETQLEMSRKLEEIEKFEHEPVATVEKASIEAVIPIRKEKALAPLNETELGVLEMLAEEGRMTAPQIREKVKLTREHTSRLMKKLYEAGYLERDTRKMPYVYSIKEEMLRILRKRAVKT